MNSSHLHLMSNHITIIGLPIAFIFLIYLSLRPNHSLKSFTLVLLIGLVTIALFIYITGDSLSGAINYSQEISKSLIDKHQNALRVSIVLTFITGVSALVALWFQNDIQKSFFIDIIVIGITLISILSLFYTTYFEA